MANGANKDQRNVVIGAMAAGIVLVVVLWLAGVFSGTEEPDIGAANRSDNSAARS